MGYSTGTVTHFNKNPSGPNAQLSACWSFQRENIEHRQKSIKETSNLTKAKARKLQKKNLSKDSQSLVMEMSDAGRSKFVCCPTYFQSDIYANNTSFYYASKILLYG